MGSKSLFRRCKPIISYPIELISIFSWGRSNFSISQSRKNDWLFESGMIDKVAAILQLKIFWWGEEINNDYSYSLELSLFWRSKWLKPWLPLCSGELFLFWLRTVFSATIVKILAAFTLLLKALFWVSELILRRSSCVLINWIGILVEWHISHFERFWVDFQISVPLFRLIDEMKHNLILKTNILSLIFWIS